MNQELIEAKAASLENVTSDHRWGFIQGAHWANEQAKLESQEPFGYVNRDEVVEHMGLVSCGTIYRHPAEGRLALYTHPPQRTEQEPVAFLANGTRFKLSMDDEGKVNCFWNQKELDGRWVALVAAEDDCHLNLTHPPQRTEQEPVGVVNINDEGDWYFLPLVSTDKLPEGTKFYTHPAQRTWVGLTI